MLLDEVLAAVGLDHVAGRGRQVVQAEDLLGLGLVHRQRRRQHARAGVGDAEQLQHALDAAVLAVAAVQGQERDVDARLPEHEVDVAVDEQRPRVVAPVGQGRDDRLARSQRHIALRGQAAHENADLALSRHASTGNLGDGQPSKKLLARRSRRRRGRKGHRRRRSVVKTGAMTFLEAALEILRHEGKPLHYKELTEHALGKKLLTFVGRTPEVTMQTQLTAAVKKAPGNPFVRVKPGIFGLLRYPEVTAEERAAYAKADAPAAAVSEQVGRTATAVAAAEMGPGDATRDREASRTGAGTGDAGGGAGGAAVAAGEDEPTCAAWRAGGRGRGRGGPRPPGGAEKTRISTRKSRSLPGCRPRRAPPHWLKPAFSKADGDETTGDEEDETSMEDDEIPVAADAATKKSTVMTRMRAKRRSWRPATRPPRLARPAAGAGAGSGDEALRGPGGEAGRRRRRRRRRGGRGGEGSGLSEKARVLPPRRRAKERPARPAEGTALRRRGRATAGGRPRRRERARCRAEDGQGGGAGGGSGEGQGPRRIMTPVDAALEILRGQAPGRGVHVRQIADGATRRRLVHGEPNEAWRVMRTALAAEPRERLRAGLRPRVRSAGAGLYALARRPPDTELERAEQVFGEARRALRERTAAALERRIAELPAAGVRGAGARAVAARGVRPGDVRQARRRHDLRRSPARARVALVALPGRVQVRRRARPAGAPSASCARASARAARTRVC